MNFSLQRAAIGLLETLRARSQGQGPQQWSDVVLPVINATPYLTAPMQVITTSAPTVGALANLTETFALTGNLRARGVSGELVIGAAGGTVVHLSIGFFDSNGTRIYLATQEWTTVVAGEKLAVGALIPEGWVVGAGLTCFALANGSPAGADHSLSVTIFGDNLTGTV